MPWTIAALAIVVAAVSFPGGDRTADPPLETWLEITIPATQDPDAFAISPDGRQLAFVATVDRRSVLFVRSLETGRTRVLESTVGAASPFWSPDGESIAFRSAGQLRRIELGQGAIQTLARVDLALGGGSWSRSGDILFPPGPAGIVGIAENGGPMEPVTRTEAGQTGHWAPQFLPDGIHFLFTAQSGDAGVAGVYVGALGESEARRVLEVDSPAAYAADNLLFVREGSLLAQRFDADTLTLAGTPRVVTSPVGAFSVSDTGTIVTRAPSVSADTFFPEVLTWFDRSGAELQTLSGTGTSPSLAPDEDRVVVFRTNEGNQDLWIIDLERDTSTRFTSFAGADLHPQWSPDGSRIVFSSLRGPQRLPVYEKSVEGGEEQVLFEADGQLAIVSDWSGDGRFLLLRTSEGLSDLWALPMDGTGNAFPWIESDFRERDGKFSPDGKWVAYASDETGRFEIYLQSFPESGRKFPVSTAGGVWPEWRADGQELYYVGLDSQIMAVPVALDPEADPRIGAPEALFTAPFRSLIGVDPQQYVVSADGQRFLARVAVDEEPPPLTVILNWSSALP